MMLKARSWTPPKRISEKSIKVDSLIVWPKMRNGIINAIIQTKENKTRSKPR